MGGGRVGLYEKNAEPLATKSAPADQNQKHLPSSQHRIASAHLPVRRCSTSAYAR